MLCHDSHSPYYRTPAGPVPAGSQVTFRFVSDDAAGVILRTWMDEERAYPMTFDGHQVWELSLTLPDKLGIFWYDFIIYHSDGYTQRYGAPEDDLGGEGHVCEGHLHSFRITLYNRTWRTPEWMHGANIYQIFPDRFYKGEAVIRDDTPGRRMHKKWNEDFFPMRERENGSMDFWGGNLIGIREKLPYLKEMGITVLYLNPIFKSLHNHHYDTGDYTKVDPLLGSEEDFDALKKGCDEAGITIMLDGVFSHTGQDSIYFNAFGRYDSLGAAQSRESPYYSWYSFEDYPTRYRCWWGDASLPECRKSDPSYQHFIFDSEEGIVPVWIKRGAGGWRLDVADELTMDFLRKLRFAARTTREDALVLGEVWEDASNKESYGEIRCYCAGDTLDSVMNYPLRSAVLGFAMGEISAFELARLIRHQAEVYPVPFRYALMNLLGSHDRARVLNMLVGKEFSGMPRTEQHKVKLSRAEYNLAVKRYKLCLDIICALPGCPTVYYGDEAGMTGCSDPFCRKPFPWGHEDINLQEFVKGRLNHHRDSVLLRTGFCEVEATDDDTLTVRRYMLDGRDAFGCRTEVTGEENFTFIR
ncbi:MAG: glycoside hydrolase family 13 protein [Clostridia bacterium]|nr:glycoside hydrolase family 13 protein [Clostridia bacterium]